MDKLRQEEKTDYAANKADMEQGVKGMTMAFKVLTECYAKDDKRHSAAEGAGSGIIGLLDVVESDFTKGLAEMTATEEASQAAYDKGTKENEIEKATKDQDVKYKSKESAKLVKSVAEESADRSGVQAELDAVLEYLVKIEARCIARAGTHEERQRRFAEEIAGLKEALEILEGDTIFVQKIARHRALRG